MSTEIAKRPITSRYTDSDVELGLRTLAAASGNRIKAAEITGFPDSTIRGWRERMPERYARIQAEIMPAIQARMAERSEEAADRLADLEMDLTRQLEAKADQLSANETAGALRNVSTAKAINVDKSQLLRGRPTEIRATADVTELLKGLSTRFGGVVTVANELEAPTSTSGNERAPTDAGARPSGRRP